MTEYRSVLKEGLFKGQCIIVTGGGSGIGRCTAHELSSLGAEVALVGRKEEKLLRVKGEIESHYSNAKVSTHICDIRIEDTVEKMVSAVLEAHGRIDGLVNNAGGQFPAMLSDISQKGWETVVRTNLTGGFLVARECFKQHMAERGGAVVNIVADMWNGMPGMGHSGAARAGMVNFTETAAFEWAPSHVRVNAVAPGYIATSGMDTYPESMGDIIRSMAAQVPLKRMGTESEVSSAICFLLSEGAQYINGTTLRVDGGSLNARTFWPQGQREAAPEYNGFSLSVKPKVLQEKTENEEQKL